MITAGETAALHWQASRDNASGVAGYRVYIGSDPNGTSDWFVPEPQTSTPPLGEGTYIVRVQPMDYAGNVGQWTTIGTIISAKKK
jgi:hypothetical protein